MKQFDVFENPVREDAPARPHLVLLTSHLIELDAVIVAPLLLGRTLAVSEAELEVALNGDAYLLGLIQMTAVRRRLLKRRIGTLESFETDIRRAIDRLFTGF